MASNNPALDLADIDASLASLNATAFNQSSDDMVPLHIAKCDIQDDSEATSSDSSSGPRKTTLPKSRAKKLRKAAHRTQASKPLLRPAKDILSRIRHDPSLDESDYIVGYHDRHADVMEMDVSEWKGGGDYTDEEWIPQHRIMYFRKKSDQDGRRVWDRASRLDRLFGSGVIATQEERDDVESEHEGEDVSDDEGRAATARSGEEDDTRAHSLAPTMTDKRTPSPQLNIDES